MKRIIDWLDGHLVEDWRDTWRKFGWQMHAVAAVLVGLFGGPYAMVAIGIAGVTTSNFVRITLIILVALAWLLVATGVYVKPQRRKGSGDGETKA